MPPLTRPNYFNGRMLTAADFQQEQNYFLGRARQHNLIAHGTGVASGLSVSLRPADGGSTIVVSPGQAIDARGNEVEIRQPRELPVPVDGESFLVVIRQVERPVNPTPVKGPRGGVACTGIVEDADVELVPEQRQPAAGTDDLVLARFRKTRTGWRRDPKRKPQRLR